MHSDCGGSAFGTTLPSAALAIAKAAVGVPTKDAGEQKSPEVDQPEIAAARDLADLEAAHLRRIGAGPPKDNTATQQESAAAPPQATKHQNKAATESCDQSGLQAASRKDQPNSSFFQALIEKEV